MKLACFEKKLILILIMIGIGLSYAESEEKKTLKLRDVIKEALENNPLQKAAEYDAVSQKAMIGPSGAYEDPMLGFEAKNYPVDTWSSRKEGMTGNEVSISQKIPFPGKLSSLRRAATFEYDSKKEMFNQKRFDLIKNVKIAYYELFLAYKKQNILKEQRNVIRQLIVVARNKYTLGKIPQAELLNLQVEEAQIIDQLLKAEKEIQAKKSNLNYILGREGKGVVGIPEEPRATPIDFLKLTPELIAEKIQHKNHGLKAVQHELEASQKKLTYAQLGYLPDFEFMAGYMFRNPSADNTRGVDMASGKIGVSIPLWAFSKQSQEIKRARADKSKAEALFAEERNNVLRMTRTLYAELKETHKRLDLYKTGIVPLAKQAVASGRSAYLANTLEYISLLNLVRQRFDAEYAHNEALANYESKIAELESLTGEAM